MDSSSSSGASSSSSSFSGCKQEHHRSIQDDIQHKDISIAIGTSSSDAVMRRTHARRIEHVKCNIYSVSQKVAPQDFSQYFHFGQVYFYEILPIVDSLYPHRTTKFGRYGLIFNKMALISEY